MRRTRSRWSTNGCDSEMVSEPPLRASVHGEMVQPAGAEIVERHGLREARSRPPSRCTASASTVIVVAQRARTVVAHRDVEARVDMATRERDER